VSPPHHSITRELIYTYIHTYIYLYLSLLFSKDNYKPELLYHAGTYID